MERSSRSQSEVDLVTASDTTLQRTVRAPLPCACCCLEQALLTMQSSGFQGLPAWASVFFCSFFLGISLGF